MMKSEILAVPMDTTACGRYRIIYPAMAMYNKAKVTISAPAKFSYYKQDVVFTQRICNSNTMKLLIDTKERYKDLKFVIDYDDNVWDKLPEYNKCNIDYEGNALSLKDNLSKLADTVTVTNEHIRKSISKFIDESKVVVIPNMLDYHRWNIAVSQPPKNNTFLFAGSPTHWAKDDYGDFSKGLVNYLNSGKAVNVMGHVPSFIPAANTVCGWVDIDDYPLVFGRCAQANRFVIAPLADNEFNKCKSDLKYIESAAAGRVCLVSTFPDCPYDDVSHPYQRLPINSTATEIKYIVERANDHYNEIIAHQYSVLTNRWLKANTYLDILSK